MPPEWQVAANIIDTAAAPGWSLRTLGGIRYPTQRLYPPICWYAFGVDDCGSISPARSGHLEQYCAARSTRE